MDPRTPVCPDCGSAFCLSRSAGLADICITYHRKRKQVGYPGVDKMVHSPDVSKTAGEGTQPAWQRGPRVKGNEHGSR